ncbi:MAG: hypothetical protein ACM3PO_00610 [Betaproteobacteria bacterium]
MSNPALDSQIKIALRDDKTAEKFAEHIAELAAQIVNATFKFAQDVKSTYESVPKRRLGDKNFDEIDQAELALGAFSFFMHVLDRFFIPMDTRIMRDTVFDFIFENVVQPVYAKSFTGPLAQTEKFVLDHFDRLTGQLADAPAIFGEGPEDGNSAMWRAGRAICAEDLGRDDRRLLVIVGNHLMRGLEDLALADKIAVMASVLRLPGHFQKIA